MNIIDNSFQEQTPYKPLTIKFYFFWISYIILAMEIYRNITCRYIYLKFIVIIILIRYTILELNNC